MDDNEQPKGMGEVIRIDEGRIDQGRIRDHPGEMVRGTVEEALKALLDAEADRGGSPLSLFRRDRDETDLGRRGPECIPAREKAEAVLAELRRQKMARAVGLVEEGIVETLTYHAFPDSHWIKIRTNNPPARIMKEIRRRTGVVGAFPDGKSCLNLAAAPRGSGPVPAASGQRGSTST